MSQEEERGRLITQLREQRLWTREKLAKEAGVSPTTVAQAEEGRTHVRLTTIGKLGRALEVNPQELLHPKAVAATSSTQFEEPFLGGEGRGSAKTAKAEHKTESATKPVGKSLTIRWRVEEAKELVLSAIERIERGEDREKVAREVSEQLDRLYEAA